ncbi:hypothetical protein D9M68_458600 [compost metagenome]
MRETTLNTEICKCDFVCHSGGRTKQPFHVPHERVNPKGRRPLGNTPSPLPTLWQSTCEHESLDGDVSIRYTAKQPLAEIGNAGGPNPLTLPTCASKNCRCGFRDLNDTSISGCNDLKRVGNIIDRFL